MLPKVRPRRKPEAFQPLQRVPLDRTQPSCKLAAVVPAAPDDGLPRRFGDYLLFDKIGEGGMARIYLGRAKTELGGERLLVVKQILPRLSQSEQFSRLLIDEAKLAAQLNHGNIVQVTDLGREDEMLYIAMEYVEGFDLRDLLRQCSKNKVPLPVEFSLLIVAETLRALDFAHRKKNDEGTPLGLVHRDVSPSNVLVGFEGEVKLCDFGIARAIGADSELPEETIQGKAGYMSPEAARGDSLDGRSDVFAVGIILWELLAGRRLYKAKGGATLEQAREAHVPELPERGYPNEPDLHRIVGGALSKDVDGRTESAQVMLRQLEEYIRGAGLVASPLKFGEWLMDHFGAEIIEKRRERERAAKAIEAGPVLQVQATGTPPAVAATVDPPEVQPEVGKPESSPASRVPSQRPAEPARGPSPWVYMAVALLVVAAAVAFVLNPS